MSYSRPTPKSVGEIVQLVFYAFVSPERFAALEKADKDLLNAQSSENASPRIAKVRAALCEALVWALSSLFFGYILGKLGVLFLVQPQSLARPFVYLGTAILLWAAFALRGWEIQTWGGETLTERVNRWIFRGLYWLGTLFLVAAATLS